MKAPKIPKAPAPPAAPPPPPTIDAAARAAEDADKLRRRKGRLATIFAGVRQRVNGASVETVKKTLTGQ